MSNQINKKVEEVKELGSSIKNALLGEEEVDTQNIIKKVAIAGGAAILVFWIITKIVGGSRQGDASLAKRKKKRKSNSIFYDLVKQQIGVIVLAIFRKQIIKLLQDYKLIDEKESI